MVLRTKTPLISLPCSNTFSIGGIEGSAPVAIIKESYGFSITLLPLLEITTFFESLFFDQFRVCIEFLEGP